MDRRRFLSSLGASALCASAFGLAGRSGNASAAVAPRSPLSLGLGALEPSYDVVVIGSGYGGAVAAARLSVGRRVCVLERGREWLPGGFPERLADVLAQFRSGTNPLGLFDYRAGADLDVLVGNGLGGTSLINANVVIAPDNDAFNRPGWPAAIRNAVASGELGTHYARVRQTLGVQRISDTQELRKHWLHRSTTQRRARAGAGAAAQFRALDLAVNLSAVNHTQNAHGVWQAPCTHCGDCVIGCRVGAKNTLDVNYLPLARRQGAELYAGAEVERVEKLATGRWRVHCLMRPAGLAPYRRTVEAGSVVVAAGTLGSTELLLRSRDYGLRVSDALGKRFSANGDLLGFAYNTDVQSNVAGFGDRAAPAGMARVGPTITAAAQYGAANVGDRFLIEEGAIPSALVDALRAAMPVAAGVPDATLDLIRIEQDLGAKRTSGALNHSMVYLGIGHDSAGGRLLLGPDRAVRVSWPTVMSEPFVARIRAEMTRHATSFAGQYVDSPRTHPLFGAAMTTVHPLGGCPMGDTSAVGVVDADCRVFDPGAGSTAVHRGLYVMDGSVVPSSLGANPLLTIAALAERASARFTA
jgi:cholesterol oxidase